MNELHDAYELLELPPGADWEAVKKKHRFLSTVWHPDRMASEDFKRQAEDKLKAINNARDILKKHFDTSHRESNCDCQESDSALQAHKERQAKERFQREQEERRRATESEERQAKARDEERKRKQQESCRQRESTENQTFAEVLNSAQNQGKQLHEHEQYVGYTLLAAKVFTASSVILLVNLGLSSAYSNSFNSAESTQKAYLDKLEKYREDKANYLEARIGKGLRSASDNLRPPFASSLQQIEQSYRAGETVKSPQTELTQEDRNDIANLEGQYMTRARYTASKEKLLLMAEKLRSATTRVNDARLNDLYEAVSHELQAAQSHLDFLNQHISVEENRIIKGVGQSYLPAQPTAQEPYTISTEAAFNSLVNARPDLFQ